jgi:hypothetical protein
VVAPSAISNDDDGVDATVTLGGTITDDDQGVAKTMPGNRHLIKDDSKVDPFATENGDDSVADFTLLDEDGTGTVTGTITPRTVTDPVTGIVTATGTLTAGGTLNDDDDGEVAPIPGKRHLRKGASNAFMTVGIPKV